MSKHMHLIALDPPSEGRWRRWHCRACESTGYGDAFVNGECLVYYGNMSPDEQLLRWVEGESLCPNSDGECCPDFSCCTDLTRTPIAARIKFAEAHFEGNGQLTAEMCVMFLNPLVNTPGMPRVHIVDEKLDS